MIFFRNLHALKSEVNDDIARPGCAGCSIRKVVPAGVCRFGKLPGIPNFGGIQLSGQGRKHCIWPEWPINLRL